MTNDRISRTAFVQGVIMLPALAGLLSTSVDAATGSKTQFKYQDHPNNGQKCSTCTFFIPGKSTPNGTCKIVAGSISPNGWCTAYSKK